MKHNVAVFYSWQSFLRATSPAQTGKRSRAEGEPGAWLALQGSSNAVPSRFAPGRCQSSIETWIEGCKGDQKPL